jgi:hypothetical protein
MVNFSFQNLPDAQPAGEFVAINPLPDVINAVDLSPSQFDVQTVPEPSASAFGCLALGLFAIVRCRRVRIRLALRLTRMRELRTLVIVLVMSFLFNGLIPVAFADEKPSAFQTELTDTTVSGYVSASADLPFPTDSDALAPADMSASFSPSSVPEPSAISLFAVGILAFAVFARSTRCGCKSRNGNPTPPF